MKSAIRRRFLSINARLEPYMSDLLTRERVFLTEPFDPSVRRGSPFARSASQREQEVGSSQMLATPETLDPEWGVLRAAIWASAWVAIFSVACYQLFPGGGVIVAAFGCGLSIVGLFSSRPLPATVLLVAHGVLFFGCYQRLF